jgi:hypothetical protein
MARIARNFQVIVTAVKTVKPMKMSFATEDKAREDIARMVTFSATARGQEAWGDLTGAVIFNKETRATITVF